jgi:hypothetical protein
MPAPYPDTQVADAIITVDSDTESIAGSFQVSSYLTNSVVSAFIATSTSSTGAFLQATTMIYHYGNRFFNSSVPGTITLPQQPGLPVLGVKYAGYQGVVNLSPPIKYATGQVHPVGGR